MGGRFDWIFFALPFTVYRPVGIDTYSRPESIPEEGLGSKHAKTPANHRMNITRAAARHPWLSGDNRLLECVREAESLVFGLDFAASRGLPSERIPWDEF